MKATLIENIGNGQKAYDSIIVDPKNIGILTNELTQKIITELSENPGCALDLARKLGQHEQKIYYHIRKLETAGIIKLLRTEKRYGMTAKIYGTSSPVVSTKLYDDGQVIEKREPVMDQEMMKFLYPFVDDGKLNAKIIAGDPYPHGKYDRGARATVHAIDFLLMLGRFLKNTEFPHYKLDVEINENDLKENLILFSNPKSNTIVEKINRTLPVHFDPNDSWHIKSKITGNVYKEPRTGMIIKCDNPFQKGKKILMIAGIRTRGMRAAIIALTQNFNELIKSIKEDGNLIRVVEGLDKEGNKVIDSVRFLE